MAGNVKKTVRLDQFLSAQNMGSRKEVSKWIRSGLAFVNGEAVCSPDSRICPGTDVVCFRGQEIHYRQYLYIMMNKPAGVLSASRDRKSRTVLDLVPQPLNRRGLFPAGRLDKDTTGLLIITDDGDFAHRMLSPKKHVYKRYEAELLWPVTEKDIEAFREGVQYGDILYAPAKLLTKKESGRNVAAVEVREGKYHQVKRMFEALGNEVLQLKRVRIGGLALDKNLAQGECREMDRQEALKALEQEGLQQDRDFFRNVPGE